MKSYALAIGMTLSSAAEIVGLYRFQPDATTFRLAKCVSGHLTEKRERRRKKGLHTHTHSTHRHTHTQKGKSNILMAFLSLWPFSSVPPLLSRERERKNEPSGLIDSPATRSARGRTSHTRSTHLCACVCVFKYSVKAKKTKKKRASGETTDKSEWCVAKV